MPARYRALSTPNFSTVTLSTVPAWGRISTSSVPQGQKGFTGQAHFVLCGSSPVMPSTVVGFPLISRSPPLTHPFVSASLDAAARRCLVSSQ